jgi:predicted P-loop ATPase
MTDSTDMPVVEPPVWDSIPSELAHRQQWLLWRFEAKEGQAKPGKIPYYVMGGRRTGDQGSEKDRIRLATLAVARRAYEKGGWSGIGFAFLPDDGLIGIDIDGALNAQTGDPTVRCKSIIDACASFTEISPSGKGVHIIVAGQTTTNKSNDIGLEVFCGKQFFTFTAKRFPGTPTEVMPITDKVLSKLHATIDDAKAKAKEAKDAAAKAARAPAAAPAHAPDIPHGGDDFRRVNDAAMQSFPAWVTSLFPGAIPRGQGYRVTSKVLGRNLQEDLSISPDGIVDFGVADMGDSKNGARTPIDLVIEWLPAASPKEALHWLAQRIGIELSGQRKRKPKIATISAPAGGDDVAPAGGSGGGGGSGGEPPGWEDDEGAAEDEVMPQLIKHRDRPMDCRENVLYALQLDKDLKGLVRQNDFTRLIERSRETPWGRPAGDWDEEDDLMLGEFFARRYRLMIKATGTLRNGVLMAARMNKYNPVIDLIKSESWDQVDRLEHWLTDVYGIEERPYTRLIGKCFFMGLVKRAMSPGCKFDYMLILKSQQGLQKSSAFRALAYPYFTDNAIRVGDKDSLMAMQMAWIVESAELESLNKSETTLIKQFLSAQEDWYRPPYGTQMVKAPRHSVSVGTTNADTFLKDATGDRRFWPLEVHEVNIEALVGMRAQLLAEALHRLEAGERYWPTKDEERDLVFPEHEPFKRIDEWENILEAYVSATILDKSDDPTTGTARAYRDFFTSTEIYDKALGIKADRIDGNGQMDMRIGNAMRALGFERHRQTSGKRLRGFKRKPKAVVATNSQKALNGPISADGAPFETDDGRDDDLPF